MTSLTSSLSNVRKSRLDDFLSDDETVDGNDNNNNVTSSSSSSSSSSSNGNTNNENTDNNNNNNPGEEQAEELRTGDGPEVTKTKKRKVFNKYDENLLNQRMGLTRVYDQFPKEWKYRGRGNEAGDLKKLITMYSEWGYQLHHGYTFNDIVTMTYKLGSKKAVKDACAALRNKERSRYMSDVLGVRERSPLTSPEATSDVNVDSVQKADNNSAGPSDDVDIDEIMMAMLDDEQEPTTATSAEASNTASIVDTTMSTAPQEDEDEEEFDMNVAVSSSSSSRKKRVIDDDDDDEEEEEENLQTQEEKRKDGEQEQEEDDVDSSSMSRSDKSVLDPLSFMASQNGMSVDTQIAETDEAEFTQEQYQSDVNSDVNHNATADGDAGDSDGSGLGLGVAMKPNETISTQLDATQLDPTQLDD